MNEEILKSVLKGERRRIIEMIRQEEKSKILSQIEKLIVAEILICHKEGTPTSRLTSLMMAIKNEKTLQTH